MFKSLILFVLLLKARPSSSAFSRTSFESVLSEQDAAREESLLSKVPGKATSFSQLRDRFYRTVASSEQGACGHGGVKSFGETLRCMGPEKPAKAPRVLVMLVGSGVFSAIFCLEKPPCFFQGAVGAGAAPWTARRTFVPTSCCAPSPLSPRAAWSTRSAWGTTGASRRRWQPQAAESGPLTPQSSIPGRGEPQLSFTWMRSLFTFG